MWIITLFNLLCRLNLGNEIVVWNRLQLVLNERTPMCSQSQVWFDKPWWNPNMPNTRCVNYRSNETSVGQFLLLIAIHYHCNQLSTISDMVASHLSIKVQFGEFHTIAVQAILISMSMTVHYSLHATQTGPLVWFYSNSSRLKTALIKRKCHQLWMVCGCYWLIHTLYLSSE